MGWKVVTDDSSNDGDLTSAGADLLRDTERAFLGGMLFDADAAARGLALVPPKALSPRHKKSFEALRAMVELGAPIELRALLHELQATGNLEAAGGPEYVGGLLELSTTAANLEFHAAIILESFAKRQLVDAGLRLSEAGKDPTANAGDISARAMAQIEEARAIAAPRGSVEYLDLTATIPPIEWFIPGWLARGDIVVLAARPAAGKSTLAADLCIALASGRAWCGIQPTVSATAIYFDEEQGSGTVLRLFQRLGAQPSDRLKIASGQGIVLGTPAGRMRLEREIEAHRPALVVLDTVAHVFAGVDLNDLAQVTRVFAGLFELRGRYGVAFLLLTHCKKIPLEARNAPNRLDLIFGSVGFSGGPSTAWLAMRGARESSLELIQAKRREAPELSMRVGFAQDGEGRITLSGEGELELATTEQARAETLLVGHLAMHPEARRSDLEELAKREGVGGGTFDRALRHLLEMKRVAQRRARGPYSLVPSDVLEELPF